MISSTMREEKFTSPEYLSNDIMDENFLRIFKVFNRLQFILGSCRVDAKNQFVTPPTRYQKCYTIICIIVSVILNIKIIDTFHTSIHDITMYYLSATSVWFGFGLYFWIILNSRFCNGHNNAEFIIRMQKVDRIMGVDKIKGFSQISRRVNNISLTFTAFSFCVVFIAVCSKHLIYWSFFGAFYSQLTGIIELIHCTNMLIYFIVRFRFVNCIMRNFLSQNKMSTKPNTFLFYSNRNLKKIALETHDFVTSDTSAYFKELFDLFSMYQDLYKCLLFIFCLKLVFGSLIVFGIILFSIQRNTINIVETSSMVMFTIFDILIAIFLGIRLQMFFGEVKEMKRLSIAVMAAQSSGPLREKARKMLKMAEETPPTLSIYDMYEMEAGIFLTIFSLITSMIVTLLQFAFL